MNSERNCPFYGHFLLSGKPLQLLPTGGNQCALVTNAHSPCALEIEGKPVDWRECWRVNEGRFNEARFV